MAAYQRSKFRKIIGILYLTLPYTLAKQFLGYRLNRPTGQLPDFLCIGTQKSGTTWLYEQLRRNPSVRLAKVKEVHYFDWYFHRGLNWYRSMFPVAQAKVTGEITPGYSIVQRGRIKFIRRIMPDVKLILLLRDPRARAWSSARYHLVNQLGRDPESITDKEFIDHFNTSSVSERGDYETIWKNWTDIFPKSQLLLIFTEELAAEPEAVLNRITDFIGADRQEDLSALFEAANASHGLEMPASVRDYLDKRYSDTIRTMPKWLGMENRWWQL